MSRYEHGRIIAVNEVKFGSNLNGDHAAGVTTLTVEDAADFDETGGQLTINGQVIDYSTFDDDTGTITLSAALSASAEDGDRVDTWDPLYGAVSAEKVAQVQLDGEDDTNTDPLEATIALHLQAALPEGLRGNTGESVLLEVDGDEWRLVDVLAQSSTIGGGTKFYDLDTFTTTAAGAQSLTLTHTPLDGSVHLGWNGLWQPHTEFAVAGKMVTVPDTAGLILSGDTLDFRYAYRDQNVNPQAVAVSTETIVPIPGTVAFALRPFGVNGPQPSRVGTGGIWNDASDGTYVELYTFDNPDASAADSSSGNIQATAVGTSTAGATVYARIRWQHLNPTAPGARGPFVSLQNNLHAYYVTDYPTGAAIVSTPTTFDVPLPITAGDLGPVLERIEAGTLTLFVQAPYVYSSNSTFPGIRVYEACLVVKRTG